MEQIENLGAQNVAAATVTDVKLLLMVETPKAHEAAQFYKAAFGAVEVRRSSHVQAYAYDARLHAKVELKICGATFVVEDIIKDSDTPENGDIRYLVTEDVGALIAKAVSLGAVKEGEVMESGGYSLGKIKDPYGFVWTISSSRFWQ